MRSSAGKEEVQKRRDNKRMEFSVEWLLVKGSRLFLQLTLAFIFLVFFGLPAIKQYLAREVMVVKTIRESGGKIATPSISINARNPRTKLGCFTDPKYFVITSNNAYFPVIKISTNPISTESFFINFDLTEVAVRF